jgi:hypothetical protein
VKLGCVRDFTHWRCSWLGKVRAAAVLPRDEEGVASPAGSVSLAASWSFLSCAGHALVAVDQFGQHTEGLQGVALSGEVLGVDLDTGVADKGAGGHGDSLAEATFTGTHSGPPLEDVVRG